MEQKNKLNQLLAILLVIALSVSLQVAVFVYGWGLTPKNWWWIVGGGVFGMAAMKGLFDKVMK